MNFQLVNRMPGIGTTYVQAFRNIWISKDGRKVLPLGVVLSGANSRDPSNATNVDVLQAGLLMGKITGQTKYAPSVLGLSGAALDGDATSLTVPALVATEIARRIGATGSVKLVGPNAANGTVRTLTAAYSAVGATTLTISALGASEVQTITPSAAPTAGSWYVRYLGDDGVAVESAALAYSATAGDIQTALRALHTDLAAVVVTNSGSAGLSDGTVTVTWPQKGATAGPHSLMDPFAKGDMLATAVIVSLTCARSATGVNGDFVTGSLIQPADGSEKIRAILDKADGEKVTDIDGVTNLDVPSKDVVIGGGLIDATQIINYPADASTQAWIKAQLRTGGGPWLFYDEY